ncbi:hypothetical protein D2E76_16570 [Mycobacteroides abscessus]|uniref:Uncharacterized protein n=2 Tax=Mycobacteroides abscessus TaxID=36809 RepID=A0ABD7HMY1_9MYCO|nr:hypothetical protein D2E76_16570 [Mycobacteroides abscessus]
MGVYGPHADAEALAVTDLQNLPTAPWEPRQADWQTSLDSWYVTARKTVTEKYTNMVRLDLDQLVTTDPACALAGTGRLATRILKEVVRQDSTADASRQSYLQLYITERTSLTGSYLAGLAAGGADINWRRWYRNEIGTWPSSHPGRRRCESEIASRTHERLPAYWTLGRG